MKTRVNLKVHWLMAFVLVMFAVPLSAQFYLDDTFYVKVHSKDYSEIERKNMTVYRANIRHYAHVIQYLDDTSVRLAEVKLRNREFRKMTTYFASDHEFSEKKLVTVVLLCWHWGTSKFLGSDFYRILQTKDWRSACAYLYTGRETPNEKKYLWVIEAIWYGMLQIEKIEKFPTQSYLNLDDKELHRDGRFIFSTDMSKLLKQKPE